MSDIENWQMFNRNVQGGLLEGRYVNAAFTLLAAGPPRMAAISNNGISNSLAWPMGVMQSFGLNQSSDIVRLWEIGSERSYFMRGRTQGSFALGRVLYHGPSLLRAAYAYLKSGEVGLAQFQQLYENGANQKLNTSGNAGSKRQFRLPPGYENLWIDLASDVFSQPIGFLVYMRDSNEDTVGAFYLEYCMANNHGFSLDSGSTVIQENAGFTYERIVPVDVQSVPLVRNSLDVANIVGSAIGSATDQASGGAGA